MDQLQWDALPPRKRSVDKQPAASASSGVNRKKVAGHQQILDNIEARRQQNSTITTLASKDGCSGTFYEYLDHTADVQCHAWGGDMQTAFENMAQCLMNYMTDLSLVEEAADETVQLTVSGHDINSLLYNYMNELLFKFSSDCFCTARAEILAFDRESFSITVKLHGDTFDPEKHSSGTEIKAITYSAMQVHEGQDRTDLYVIVDI